MKVSRRELSLLIFLLCIGVGYLLYSFLFSPLLKQIAASNEALLSSQTRLEVYQLETSHYDIEKLQQEQTDEIVVIEETAKPLLPYIDDGEITAFINTLAQSQNIRVFKVILNPEELYDTALKSIVGTSATYPLSQAAEAFRKGDLSLMEPVPSAPPAVAAAQQIDQIPTVIGRATVEIQFSGVTYAQVSGFIKQLEAAGRAIYLNTVFIGDESGGTLKASLVFGFMQVDKLTDTDTGLAEVTGPLNTGKTDPFSGNG